jgi:ATP phosphoribosyltransferase regulatory subunit HisZ
MSLLNNILSQVSDNATVQNLAAKVGMTPEQVEQAVAALGQAHASEGDTVTTAAAQTGLPQDKLQEIVGHIGGEGALGRFASLLQEDGAAGGILGSIKNFIRAWAGAGQRGVRPFEAATRSCVASRCRRRKV